MNIIVLNSGSNGNAIYVESAESGSGILLDCGISRRQIETRLKVHGRYADRIRAVFITHEHADHACGLSVLTKMYHMSVYLTEPTYRMIARRAPFKGFRFISNTDTVTVDDITIQAFPKNHDAVDPVFFLVSVGNKKFLYITDLGIHNENIAALLSQVDALLLESNYDHDMLWKGNYPEHLKARIHADYGHLSNTQTMTLIDRHCDGRLKTLILGHLSENNNCPGIVKREINAILNQKSDFTPLVYIASRYTVSDVIAI